MNAIVIDDERSALHLFFDSVINSDLNMSFRFFEDNLERIFKHLESNVVDIIFLDIRMNSIDGRILAEKIFLKYPSIKFVFFTGLNVTMDDLPCVIKENVLGILYKPFNEIQFKNIIKIAQKSNNILKINMLGGFDCFINDKIVHFSSSKSKELFALLVALEGKSLSMEYAIKVLWNDKELSKAKILYRDAVWRLRTTLKEINFQCVEFKRAHLSLNKNNIECDFYDSVKENKEIHFEKYLTTYPWSNAVLSENYSFE